MLSKAKHRKKNGKKSGKVEQVDIKKKSDGPRIIVRGTSAHFCQSVSVTK